MTSKSNKDKGEQKSKPSQPVNGKGEKKSPLKNKLEDEDVEDDDFETGDATLPKKLSKTAPGKKQKKSDDDEEVEDDEKDDWEKPEEEEAWDPDFDEFDVPGGGAKKPGKKGAAGDEDEDFTVDPDLKEFDMFNDDFDDEEEDDDF